MPVFKSLQLKNNIKYEDLKFELDNTNGKIYIAYKDNKLLFKTDPFILGSFPMPKNDNTSTCNLLNQASIKIQLTSESILEFFVNLDNFIQKYISTSEFKDYKYASLIYTTKTNDKVVYMKLNIQTLYENNNFKFVKFLTVFWYNKQKLFVNSLEELSTKYIKNGSKIEFKFTLNFLKINEKNKTIYPNITIDFLNILEIGSDIIYQKKIIDIENFDFKKLIFIVF